MAHRLVGCHGCWLLAVLVRSQQSCCLSHAKREQGFIALQILKRGLSFIVRSSVLQIIHKHRTLSRACHCHKGHGGCCDLTSTASSQGPAIGL